MYKTEYVMDLLNIKLVLSNLESVHMFWLAGLDLIPCGMYIHMNLYSEASVSLRPPNRKVLPLTLPSLPFPTLLPAYNFPPLFNNLQIPLPPYIIINKIYK